MADAASVSTVQIPLPDDGVNSLGTWKTRIEGSKSLIDRLKPDWDKNLERYLVKRPQAASKDEIVVPKDYANVEQKKALLFFQTPDVQLEPKLPGLEDATHVFTRVINHYLGPDGVNAHAMAQEVLSDALCPSGIFATKIGYEATINGTKPVQVGTQPDPNFQPPPPAPGNVLNIQPPQPPMVPVMQDVPNIISEKYVWERISPAKVLIPEEFHGSDFDKAPWLGFEFLLPFETAKRAFNLPPDFKDFVVDDDRRLGQKTDAASDGRGKPKRVRGYEIWYKAALFDETEKNPDRLRLLVIIDGLKDTAKHENSPYQVDEEDGTLGGMVGFPVHVGTLRYVPDQAIPPSDCQMSRFQVEEISKGRTQMIQQRQRSIPFRVGPVGLGEEFYSKLEKAIWQAVIPIPDDQFLQYGADGPIKEVSRGQFPRENFTFDEIANRDLEQAWAIGNNQNGAMNETQRTATELQIAQSASSTRMKAERTRFLEWFVRGVAKLGSLIQQFATEQSYVAIVGPDGSQRLEAWDKHRIQGKFVYKAKPDSQIDIDAATARAQATQLYNLLANSSFINQQELITNVLSGKPPESWDTAKLIVTPQPKPADVPKISYAFKGEDLNPANPAFPIVVEVLRQGGIQLSDQAILAAQQHVATMTGMPAADAVPHNNPNAPPPATSFGSGANEPVSKHAMERTGQRPGPPVKAA